MKLPDKKKVAKFVGMLVTPGGFSIGTAYSIGKTTVSGEAEDQEYSVDLRFVGAALPFYIAALWVYLQNGFNSRFHTYISIANLAIALSWWRGFVIGSRKIKDWILYEKIRMEK